MVNVYKIKRYIVNDRFPEFVKAKTFSSHKAAIRWGEKWNAGQEMGFTRTFEISTIPVED